MSLELPNGKSIDVAQLAIGDRLIRIDPGAERRGEPGEGSVRTEVEVVSIDRDGGVSIETRSL